jgi:hypothetical protein
VLVLVLVLENTPSRTKSHTRGLPSAARHRNRPQRSSAMQKTQVTDLGLESPSYEIATGRFGCGRQIASYRPHPSAFPFAASRLRVRPAVCRAIAPNVVHSRSSPVQKKSSPCSCSCSKTPRRNPNREPADCRPRLATVPALSDHQRCKNASNRSRAGKPELRNRHRANRVRQRDRQLPPSPLCVPLRGFAASRETSRLQSNRPNVVHSRW